MTIVHNLKNVGGNSYENGTILDPKSGKTYKLKGELAEGGKNLNYVVILAFQHWAVTKLGFVRTKA